jgi:4-hydroxybenzoate polyprenyltransferase
MAGAGIARPNDFYTGWKAKEALVYLLAAFFFLSHIKDLKDIEGDRAAGVFNLFGAVLNPRALTLIVIAAFLAMAFLAATGLGVPVGATSAGTAACAAASLFMTLRTPQPAGLDRLFGIAFCLVMVLSGAWIYHFLG